MSMQVLRDYTPYKLGRFTHRREFNPSDSFFCCLGFAFFEGQLTLKSPKFSEISDRNITHDLAYIKKLDPQQTGINPDLIEDFMNFFYSLKTLSYSGGLSRYYNELSTKPNYMIAIRDIIKGVLLHNNKSIKSDLSAFKHQDDYFHLLSSRLKVHLSIISGDRLIFDSRSISAIPIIHLLLEQTSDTEVYSLLYHRNAFETYIRFKQPPEEYPFVWKPDYFSSLFKDFEEPFELSCESNSSSLTESTQVSVSVNSNSLFSALPDPKLDDNLLDFLSSLLLQLNLPSSDLAPILSIYTSKKLSHKNFELLIYRANNHPSPASTFDFSALPGITCSNCSESLDSCPQISCSNHSLCLKCRVKSFKSAPKSICPKCYRPLSLSELSLLNSFN